MNFRVASFVVSWGLLLLTLSACSSESLSLTSEEKEQADLGQNADSNLLRLREGATVIVTANIIRPEIEGSTAFKVETLRADDPALVDVAFVRDATFRLTAKKPGETILRAAIDGDERAVVPIRVLAKAM